MPKINYKPANLRGLGTDAQLKPGWNDVPDTVWEKWRNDGEIKALAKAGMIEVEGDEPAAPPAKKAKAAKAAPAAKPPPPPPAPAPEEEDDTGSELSDEELEKLTSEAAK